MAHRHDDARQQDQIRPGVQEREGDLGMWTMHFSFSMAPSCLRLPPRLLNAEHSTGSIGGELSEEAREEGKEASSMKERLCINRFR